MSVNRELVYFQDWTDMKHNHPYKKTCLLQKVVHACGKKKKKSKLWLQRWKILNTALSVQFGINWGMNLDFSLVHSGLGILRDQPNTILFLKIKCFFFQNAKANTGVIVFFLQPNQCFYCISAFEDPLQLTPTGGHSRQLPYSIVPQYWRQILKYLFTEGRNMT